jgi:hypothetical protein
LPETVKKIPHAHLLGKLQVPDKVASALQEIPVSLHAGPVQDQFLLVEFEQIFRVPEKPRIFHQVGDPIPFEAGIIAK